MYSFPLHRNKHQTYIAYFAVFCTRTQRHQTEHKQNLPFVLRPKSVRLIILFELEKRQNASYCLTSQHQHTDDFMHLQFGFKFGPAKLKNKYMVLQNPLRRDAMC